MNGQGRDVKSCLLGWLLLALASPALAVDACRDLTDHTAESLTTFRFETDTTPREDLPAGETFRLGEIDVVRQNVFEEENNWLHGLANRWHRRTRENVVLSVLPMVQGDPVDKRLLAEAERILRRKIYLYDARVIPRRLCGEVLDIIVVTRDVWTLMPQISLERTGSETDVGFGVIETNLLGSGRYVSLGYEKDKDRRGITFAYGDANVGDSRWAIDLAVVDNDDGERAAAGLERPFYALNTRYAVSAAVDNFSREEGLYFLGDEIWEYQADTRTFRAFAGWSSGLVNGFVNRLLLGYAHEYYGFDMPTEFDDSFPDVPNPDREYSYPFIAFHRIEDDFQTGVNLDRVHRTEDIALGREIYAELGFSTGAASSDGRLVGRFHYSDASWVAPRQLLTFRTWLDGFYDLDSNSSENLAVGGLLAYRYQHAEDWSLLVQSSLTAIWNPTLDQQLLAGGATGLRGYPNRYQIGDRRMLLTVEERYYSELYPWRLFRLGAAVFVDVGRAWYQGDVPDWVPERDGDHFGVLANAGIGLRMESTRTRGDQILHLDVAFPLRGGPGVRDVEVTLTAKQTL